MCMYSFIEVLVREIGQGVLIETVDHDLYVGTIILLFIKQLTSTHTYIHTLSPKIFN